MCVFKFFHQYFVVFHVQVFHFLVKLIPMGFVLFDAVVSGIIFLILF